MPSQHKPTGLNNQAGFYMPLSRFSLNQYSVASPCRTVHGFIALS